MDARRVPLLHIRCAGVEITSNPAKIGVGRRFSIEQRDLLGDVFSWGKHGWRVGSGWQRVKGQVLDINITEREERKLNEFLFFSFSYLSKLFS
jgi:hypothetical protein